MCGIDVVINYASDINKIQQNKTQIKRRAIIKQRGPDFQYEHKLEIKNGDIMIDASFYSSVLQMRGPLTKQPFICQTSGNIFMWNGEAFNDQYQSRELNDGELLSRKLFSPSSLIDIEKLVQIFNDIEGPFAFVFFDKVTNTIYYGRDFMGRRSLMINQSEGQLQISSVGVVGESWNEIPSGYIHSFNLITKDAKTVQCSQGYQRKLDQSQIPQIFPDSNSEYELFLFGPMDQTLLKIVKERIISFENTEESGEISIMFSGGIDCSILAALVHRVAPINYTIKLLNVAFENPRYIRTSKVQDSQKYEVPDRLTGRQSFTELQLEYPDREWKFIECNVSYEEYQQSKNQIIELMYPLDTVMDLSIASAFWFASHTKYCQTKIVFSGLGPDELLAGYGHHRKAYEKSDFDGLYETLQMDFDRLPYRNLGRDDRLISSHGKELRVPFLAKEIVNLFLGLPVAYKCNMQLPEGLGDKMLLRQYAKKVLRLPGIALEKKRAVQFGAKTAKMTDGKEHGYDKVLIE